MFTRISALPVSSTKHGAKDSGTSSSGSNTTSPDTETTIIGGQTYTLKQSPAEIAICRASTDTAADIERWKVLTAFQVQPCSGAERPLKGQLQVSQLTPELKHAFECTHSSIIECQTSWSTVQRQTNQGQSYLLRSVDGIIHYLGEVQRRVDADHGPDDQKKGVTWTEGGIVHTLFQLHYESVNDRIAVTYGGRNYYVREGDPADHTLQVLSLLSQLINANKNANEIPTTKAVQIVP